MLLFSTLKFEVVKEQRVGTLAWCLFERTELLIPALPYSITRLFLTPFQLHLERGGRRLESVGFWTSCSELGLLVL